MDWKQTLNLPNADFTIPMKADLATREPELQRRWAEIQIYNLLQESRKDAKSFVLHDGPPYTNGPIHNGTALNKLLKDFVLKSRSLMGFRCPYVPGYDNHGLPIETAVLRAWAEEVKSDPVALQRLGFAEKPGEQTLINRLKAEIVELRQRCRAHAARYIDVQTEQFQRLGIFGMWDRPYTTMDYRFEAEIVRVFARAVARDLIYKGLRPVLWSPTSRTALADTEIVYKTVTSKAIYVAFELKDDPHHRFAHYPRLHTIIWTTTAWTLPANVACAFHPEYLYAVLRAGDRHYLVLQSLAERTMAAIGITDYQELAVIPGEDVTDVTFQHPFLDRASRAVTADYVTTEDGTGVVHTAPGHGREDFITGLKHNLPILCPVNGEGILTDEAGPFAGLYYAKAVPPIIEHLKESGALLAVSDYEHTYPHAERDEQPVIFRTTEQWFISMDEGDLRKTMLREIETVQWYPANAKNRIGSMIEGRPDWCISRQRPWGVGIPVFYGKKSGQPVLDSVAIEAVAKLVETEGSDAWFVREPSEILPAGFKHPETGETEFTKETDVFDVWFDSGSTSLCVLEGNVEPRWKDHWPADLYLEGSDQHRGWFNASLILGTACRDGAPYRQVVTHGMVLDEQMEKMSKRKGNVVDPVEACNTAGADVLRYWAASVDYQDDVRFGENIFRQAGESYRSVRNTMRFLLGNLEGFSVDSGAAATHDLDIWVMEQTDLLVADCMDAYERYDFAAVTRAVHNFCAVELSRFYLDAIKDRMYCDGPQWPSRQSAQAASLYVLVRLVKLLAPILAHTAEEVYGRLPIPNRLPSVHMETLERPSEARIEEIGGNAIQTRFAQLLELRGEVFAALDASKSEELPKNSQDVIVRLGVTQDAADLLASFGDDLPNYFKMSGVEWLVQDARIEFRASEYLQCDRSRVRRPDVQAVTLKNGESANLSARDAKAVSELHFA